jgi:hypothetical protein
MRKGFTFTVSFFVGAALLGAAPACIIVTDDGDDTAGDTGNGSSNPSTSDDDTAAPTNTSTPADGDTTAAESSADSTAAAETAGTPTCGWGPTGDATIPEGYVCDGEGEDPDGNFPLLCPDDIELVVGGACGSIMGQGCCDAAGDAWFCGDDGSGPALALIEC